LLYLLEIKKFKLLDFSREKKAFTVINKEIYSLFTYTGPEDLYGIIANENEEDFDPLPIRPSCFTEEDY